MKNYVNGCIVVYKIKRINEQLIYRVILEFMLGNYYKCMVLFFNIGSQ